MTPSTHLQPGKLLTIGELSARTGISTHTLRMWEKRYGAPQAIRLPSGHRRYLPEEVERLRVVARALELGYRAGKVAGGSQEELQQLLGLDLPNSSGMPPAASRNEADRSVEQWLEWIDALNSEALIQDLHRTWGERGPLEFVNRLMVPFVVSIGREWECGRFTVAQEHFATEIITHFLADRWSRSNERKEGPCIILSTLAGESHILGLQMCAAVIAVTDWRIVSLGLDVPEQDIIRTVEQCQAPVLCLSISEWYGVSRARPILWRLRKQLRKNTHIIAGGGGAPDDLSGVQKITDFDELHQWLHEYNIP